MISLKNNYIQQLLNLSFYALAFFPLLDYGMSAIIVGVFLFLNLINNGIKPNFTWFFTIFYFYLLFISFLYSDFSSIISRLDSSFFLVIFPIFSSSFKLNKEKFKVFSYIYITVIILKSLLSTIILINNSSFLSGGELPFFSVQFHGTFFSYEVLIAILLTYFYIENSFYRNIILSFLSLVILLFQKKIALLSLLFLLIIQKKIFKRIYLSLIIPFSILFVYFKRDVFSKFYETTSNYLNFTLVGTDKVRLRLYEAGWENFKQAPILGKGVVEHTSFFSHYNLIHLGKWSEHMNTHNYFVFLACSGGIFALLLFLLPYIYSFYKYKFNSKIFIVFLSLSLLFNLTESFLDRYNGTLPFVVFLFLFYKISEINLNNPQNEY